MQNEAGEYVDMYIPRKCSDSNRILSARDHASIQINLASVDESTGHMTGGFTTYSICGAIRRSDPYILLPTIFMNYNYHFLLCRMG